MKKKQRAIIPAMVAVIAGAMTVFIAKSNEEPSDCFTWKVEMNESVFYLTGSIHAAGEENYPLEKTYMKGYKKSDKVIFELEDDFEILENKIFEYASKDQLPDGLNLGDSLSAESIDKLKEIIEEEDLAKYLSHEAWLLNMTIAGAKSKLIGFDPLLAVDKYFHDLATKDGKEIIGLDEIETQLALFDFDVPFPMQIQVLENAIANMEMQAKAEEGLYQSYFTNDIFAFEAAFLKPYDFSNPQMKGIYDMVFTRRNTAWVDRFEELSTTEQGTYFVLVGAGHFFGPNNVRQLLESKGYIVEKI